MSVTLDKNKHQSKYCIVAYLWLSQNILQNLKNATITLKPNLDLQKADDYYFDETSEFYLSGEIHSQQNDYHQTFRKPYVYFLLH